MNPPGRSSGVTESIKRAALSSIAHNGADLTSLKTIAEDAGVSTGPVYSLYESVDDVMAHVFDEVLAERFEEICRLSRSWCLHGDAEGLAALTKELESPSKEVQALLETLVVARRFPLTGELVRGRVTASLRAHLEASGDVPPGLAISQVTVVFGGLLLDSAVPNLDAEHYGDLLGLLREANQCESCRAQASLDVPLIQIPLPRIETEDQNLHDIANAIVKVITQTGYEKATANRIARASGQGFSRVYRNFDSKEQLMESVAISCVDQLVALNLAPFIGVGRHAYLARSATMGRALSSDDNRATRHLRLETMVAAKHHPKIGAALRSSLSQSDDVLKELVDGHVGGASHDDLREARALWAMVRANGLGISLLSANSNLLESIDWSPGSAALYGLLEARHFG